MTLLLIPRPTHPDYFYAHLGGIGVTVGAHRLWAHKGYQASLPFRLMICVFFTIAGQNDLITWARDHRVSF